MRGSICTDYRDMMTDCILLCSGHWLDDPCEFAHTVICGVDDRWTKFREWHGEDLAQKETLAMAVVAGFGSTVAQAHNQGK